MNELCNIAKHVSCNGNDIHDYLYSAIDENGTTHILEAWQSTRKYTISVVGTTTTPTNKMTSKSSPGLSRAALYM